MRLLVVDNYDSFTYNLVHLFGALDAELTVLRNDDPALDEAAVGNCGALVLGPGPGRPADAGKLPLIVAWAERLRCPVLGVCLGQQAIGEHFGAQVIHAPALVHGKTSAIDHDGSGVFASLPSPVTVTRYHSLCVTALPETLRVTARSADGVAQGVAHRTLPIYGVQFHPESVLTPDGPRMAANFLAIARAWASH
jgi:anthranilate synthase/aminodeoxychorismate synthase-like glutamine amidotransferase